MRSHTVSKNVGPLSNCHSYVGCVGGGGAASNFPVLKTDAIEGECVTERGVYVGK